MQFLGIKSTAASDIIGWRLPVTVIQQLCVSLQLQFGEQSPGSLHYSKIGLNENIVFDVDANKSFVFHLVFKRSDDSFWVEEIAGICLAKGTNKILWKSPDRYSIAD